MPWLKYVLLFLSIQLIFLNDFIIKGSRDDGNQIDPVLVQSDVSRLYNAGNNKALNPITIKNVKLN